MEQARRRPRTKFKVYIYIIFFIEVVMDCIFNSISYYNMNKAIYRRFTFTSYYMLKDDINTNGVLPSLDNNITRVEVDHGNWKRVFVTLPPFYWNIPKGLNKTWVSWFWYQKENHRHFKDSLKPITGVVRIIKNGSFSGSFSRLSNLTHYINLEGQPEFSRNANEDTVMYIAGHQIQYFQHFFDNGIPHIMLMLFACQLHPSNITIRMSSCLSGTISNTLKWVGFKNVIFSGERFSATTLILPEIVPVIHPLYHQNFRNYLKINFSEFNKIIFISRKPSDNCKNMRIINNQDEICDALLKKYGKNFVIFRANSYSFEQTVELFSKASIIIGAHGGAMYNQMFSPSNTSVVEIMPIMPHGLYVGQSSRFTKPPFAHLAIHTNCLMLGQKFFRYYQPTTLSGSNMVINVVDFLEWISSNIQ